MPTRNVINVSDVERFVDEFAERTDHPALKRWLASTVRRWILKHYDRTDRVVLDPNEGSFALAGADGARQPYVGAVPDWAAVAIARGDQVVYLRLGATLHKRAHRALTALAAELEDGTLSTPDRMPFPKAEARAKKLRHARHIARRKARVADAIHPVYCAPTGDTVVRLPTSESLADEGSRMGHCVATYDYWVTSGQSEIYSVRDTNGKSRATVEVDLYCVDRVSVWQIKGFANGPVEPRYRPALQGFIRSLNYPVDDDRDNLLTDDAAYAVNPKWLESLLYEGGGLAWLRANRFAGYKATRDAQLGFLLRTLTANAEYLSDTVLSDLFDALRPDHGIYLRTRRTTIYSIYGIPVTLYYVELPLPLLHQVRHRTFNGRAMAGLASAVYQGAEAAVIRLALSAPNKLYALGPTRARDPWEIELLECPSDVLQRSQIDVTGLRAARHQALRRAMNEAKRRHLSLSAKPSVAHVAVRRLLDGSRRQFVL